MKSAAAIKAACVAAVCIGVAAVVGRGQVDTVNGGGGGGNPGDVALPGPAAVVIMNQSPPPTRMDAMLATHGAVILRGYTEIGAVQGEDGSGVGVTAVELTDAARGQKEYGLAVGVRRPGRGGVAVQTYVDYDEIDALSAAMDQLNRLDSTATQLAGYEGRFRTKADLAVANFADNSGARMVSVRGVQVLPETGQVVYATAYFPLARFAEIRQLVAAGKQTIDKAHGGNEK